MAWCPNCKAEYREGFDVCKKCECSLVEKLEEENEEEMTTYENHDVFLINTRDDIEASVIEGILSASNIAVTIKYRDAGGYLNIYMGNSVMGTDIYVSEKDYELAKEIISAEIDAQSEEYIEESEEEKSIFEKEIKVVQKKRSLKAWIVIWLITPGLLSILVYFGYVIISSMSK